MPSRETHASPLRAHVPCPYKECLGAWLETWAGLWELRYTEWSKTVHTNTREHTIHKYAHTALCYIFKFYCLPNTLPVAILDLSWSWDQLDN